MRGLAARGYSGLKPEACLEVAEAFIHRSTELGVRLDLRLITNVYHNRLRQELGDSEVDWRDMLEGWLQQRVVEPTRPMTTQEKEVELAVSLRGSFRTTE